MTDKQKYQRRQINRKIYEAMHYCENTQTFAKRLVEMLNEEEKTC